MNEEVNNFLKANLEEAHDTFKAIISEMKDENISIDYSEVEKNEQDYYLEVAEIMNKLNYYVLEAKALKEDQDAILEEEYKLYLKYFALYVVSLAFIRIFYEIVDTSKLNEMVKYAVGMFLGSTYMGLLNKDLRDNRSDTKDKRDLINRLKTMKEEYKATHDEVVLKIDCMFDLNTRLWGVLDRERTKNKQKI